MGPKGSDVWNSLLDAAEIILIEQGAAELTSRVVAARVGVKQQLVYYYFRTMDELIVETFRRLAVRELARLRESVENGHSVRTMWNIWVESADTRLVSEFMAMTHRISSLEAEVRQHVEQCRLIQTEALSRSMAARGNTSVSAGAAALIGMSIALTLQREARIGVSSAHDEVLKIVTDFLDHYDPED
jgi:AcrR family transcriptional regulator